MSAWIGLIGVVAGSLITFFGTVVVNLTAERRGRERARRAALLDALDAMIRAFVAFEPFAQARTSGAKWQVDADVKKTIGRVRLLLSAAEKDLGQYVGNAYEAMTEPPTSAGLVVADLVDLVPAWYRGEVAAEAMERRLEQRLTPEVLRLLEEASRRNWAGLRE